MSKKIGTALMVLGVLFVLSAAALFVWNRYEEQKAADAAGSVLEQLQDEIHLDQKPFETNDTDQTEPMVITQITDPAMPTLELDGYLYIGYLSIPDLSLELPVMDSWDYTKLKVAPCRYYGSYKTNDLVIAGHRYPKHFGGLKDLSVGSPVYFTDTDGYLHTYRVVAIEILQPTDVLPMVESPFDLNLYTCTYGGSERVTVRCQKTE